MKKWLNYQLNTHSRNYNHTKLDCEICASPISFAARRHYRCNSLKKVKRLVNEDKPKFVMSMVIEAFLLGVLGFLIGELMRRAEAGDGQIWEWIPLYGIVGISLISGWVGIVMVRRILIRREVEVTGIGSRREND